MADTYKMLTEHCKEIAHDLDKYAENNLFLEEDEDYDGQNYLDDYLDVKWILDSDRDYFACRVCVGWGGPNIYIDTWEKCVCGYWGADTVKYPMSLRAVEAVDEYMSEIYFCC